ncbi:putative membrane protein YesL [Cytobacillus eiseniae]|uniref:Membrane protein YesL n=1 Tax=Cytobacillus eiseniae TaxID=762947 RepID=A0ABS4RJI3_9BACI|nr:hypothetical protein [Cytobacillus eiseniae]MBP2243067.1 putative membrane protein YesL [Cytobacillus eiseniae]
MSLILFLLIGLMGVYIIILIKRPSIEIIKENNSLLRKLKNATWFQNHWLAGIFLFVLNAVLFFSTALLLYVLTSLIIPFIHWLVIIFATIGSVFLWIIMSKAWQGTKRNRLKMGAIGSSFFLILSLMFIYKLVTLKPSYLGEDTFMEAVGFVLGIVVTMVAFITCFIFTGYSNKKIVK